MPQGDFHLAVNELSTQTSLVSILPGKVRVRGPQFLMVGRTDSSTFSINVATFTYE